MWNSIQQNLRHGYGRGHGEFVLCFHFQLTFSLGFVHIVRAFGLKNQRRTVDHIGRVEIVKSLKSLIAVLFCRLSSEPPISLSTNHGSESAVWPRPPPPTTNQAPPFSPGRAAGAEPNGRQPITDLLGDDVSLLSPLSGPSSHHSLLSEPGAAGGQPGSSAGRDPAAGDAAARPASLAELNVPLEEITPGELLLSQGCHRRRSHVCSGCSCTHNIQPVGEQITYSSLTIFGNKNTFFIIESQISCFMIKFSQYVDQ